MKLVKYCKRIKSLFSSIILLFGFIPTQVIGGSYEMLEGKGVAVCDTYFKYLKTQTRPLTCKRDFPPEMSQLQRPAWKQLDINKNKLLILRIENYLQIPRDEKATQPWGVVHSESDLTTYSVSKHAKLSISDLDIDNDGVKETIAKYRSFFCNTWDSERGSRWRAPIVVLDASKQTVNIKKTYPLMQNSEKMYLVNYEELQVRYNELSRRRMERRLEIVRREKTGENYIDIVKSLPPVSVPKVEAKFKPSIYAAGVAQVQGYDIFFYKNTTYFDKWDENKTGASYQVLTVYKNSKLTTDIICRFKYHN